MYTPLPRGLKAHETGFHDRILGRNFGLGYVPRVSRSKIVLWTVTNNWANFQLDT